MASHNIKELLDLANYHAVFLNQIDLLKAKFEQQTLVHSDGGTFQVTPTFLVYLQSVLGTGSVSTPSAIFCDKYDKPVLIKNLAKFVDECRDAHSQALLRYFTDYQLLEQSRSIQAALAV